MTDLARTFAALADPTRLRIVEHLLREGETPAGGLTRLADMSPPAVSRHLKVLHAAGLIERRVDGTRRLYSARPEAMRGIAAWTLDHRAFWDQSFDRLDALLALDPEGED